MLAVSAVVDPNGPNETAADDVCAFPLLPNGVTDDDAGALNPPLDDVAKPFALNGFDAPNGFVAVFDAEDLNVVSLAENVGIGKSEDDVDDVTLCVSADEAVAG